MKVSIADGDFGKEMLLQLKEYKKRLFKKLGYYDDVYQVIKLKMRGKLSTIRHFKLLYSLYKHMKKEEKRFGFEINMDKLVNLLNAL